MQNILIVSHNWVESTSCKRVSIRKRLKMETEREANRQENLGDWRAKRFYGIAIATFFLAGGRRRELSLSVFAASEPSVGHNKWWSAFRDRTSDDEGASGWVTRAANEKHYLVFTQTSSFCTAKFRRYLRRHPQLLAFCVRIRGKRIKIFYKSWLMVWIFSSFSTTLHSHSLTFQLRSDLWKYIRCSNGIFLLRSWEWTYESFIEMVKLLND